MRTPVSFRTWRGSHRRWTSSRFIQCQHRRLPGVKVVHWCRAGGWRQLGMRVIKRYLFQMLPGSVWLEQPPCCHSVRTFWIRQQNGGSRVYPRWTLLWPFWRCKVADRDWWLLPSWFWRSGQFRSRLVIANRYWAIPRVFFTTHLHPGWNRAEKQRRKDIGSLVRGDRAITLQGLSTGVRIPYSRRFFLHGDVSSKRPKFNVEPRRQISEWPQLFSSN